MDSGPFGSQLCESGFPFFWKYQFGPLHIAFRVPEELSCRNAGRPKEAKHQAPDCDKALLHGCVAIWVAKSNFQSMSYAGTPFIPYVLSIAADVSRAVAGGIFLPRSGKSTLQF